LESAAAAAAGRAL
jgi:hypothetical protein